MRIHNVALALTCCVAAGVVSSARILEAGADQGGGGHQTGGVSAANIYTVTLTQPLAANAFAPPLDAACNAGDAVLSGSCTQETDSTAPIAVHESHPTSGNGGWRCTVSNQWSFTATLRTTAVCIKAQ